MPKDHISGGNLTLEASAKVTDKVRSLSLKRFSHKLSTCSFRLDDQPNSPILDCETSDLYMLNNLRMFFLMENSVSFCGLKVVCKPGENKTP